MAFTKRELGHIEETVGALCHRRTSPQFKNQLSIEYRVKRHDVTIVERRPHWTGKPGFTERECAKLKFALSKRFPSDRVRYTRGKTKFIDQAMTEALESGR